METTTLEERQAFMDRLHAELPHFVHHLLYEHQIESRLQSSRYGISHYHHPEIVAALEEHTPESRLLQMIDEVMFSERNVPLDLTANEVQVRLLKSSVDYQARQIFNYSGACGALLSKLATQTEEERVQKRFVHGKPRYRILPPSIDTMGPPEPENWVGGLGQVSNFNKETVNNNNRTNGPFAITDLETRANPPTQKADEALVVLPKAPVINN